MRERLRVLLHVQHLLGVGHVKRAAAIARAMAAEGMDVLALLGGVPEPLARFDPVATLQLPAIRAGDVTFRTLVDAEGRAVSAELMAERRALVVTAATRHRPHAVVTEHYPFGRRKLAGEIDALLAAARQCGRPLVASSVRDVLVDKADAKAVARVLAILARDFDRVLVHGDPSLIPFDRTFPAASEIVGTIAYTGYIADEPWPTAGAGEAGDIGRGEIVVSAGGGAVGERLLRTALATARVGALADRRWRLLVGAAMPEQARTFLLANAPANVTVEPARPDFRAILGRAALSISQAGYNTIMDLLVARCPALVVPFAAGGESEQLVRALELERRGILTVLDEARLDVESLVAAAATALARPPARLPAIGLDGARASARLVREMVLARQEEAT
jgi:predicted glycosyltransferase